MIRQLALASMNRPGTDLALHTRMTYDRAIRYTSLPGHLTPPQVEYYRDRVLDLDEPVWAYRNLNREDTWYSLVQSGMVRAHAREIALRVCNFEVRAGGRDRVRASGVKNVHAYVVGLVVQDAGIAQDMLRQASSAAEPSIHWAEVLKYDPAGDAPGFTAGGRDVTAARFVTLSAIGARAWKAI